MAFSSCIVDFKFLTFAAGSAGVVVGEIEKITRQAQTSAIRQLCRSTLNILFEGRLDTKKNERKRFNPASGIGMGFEGRFELAV